MKYKEQNGWWKMLSVLLILTMAACGGGGEGDDDSTGVPVVLGQPGPGDAGNHFPFAVGNSWSYQVTNVESGLPPQTFVSTVSVTGTRQVDGATATVLQETNADGTNVAEDTSLVKDLNGIAEIDDTGSTDPLISQLLPVWDYRFPLAENSSFVQVNRKGLNSGDDLDGDGINEMVDIRSEVAVLGLETVTVPVGTFADCVNVRISLTFIYILSTDGRRVTATGVYHEWFSPGIGQVKGTSALSITLGNFTETTSETEELIGYSVGGQSQKIRIEASPAAGSLSVGGALQLTAVASSPAGVPVQAPPLVWLSNNPFVASVDANGLVRGVSAGSAFINATLVQGPFTLATNDVTVTVGAGTQPFQPFQPLMSIQITPSPVVVAAGGTVQLTATGRDPYGNGYFVSAFTWQSGNMTVASVDANGLVTGVAPGITTITASAGGISSTPVTVTVSDMRQIALATNDLVFDPFVLKIYASVPGRAGVNGNSVAVINPETGQIERFIPVGSEPKKLALSDDGRFLYVALDGTGSVARLDLNAPSAPVLDLTFALGSDSFSGLFYVEDMEVMPGTRGTVAISRMFKWGSPRHAGVAIFDDGVQRPVVTPGHTGSNVIEFSASPGILYGYNNETTEFGFRRMAVEADGVTVLTTDSSLISGFGTDIEFADGLLYASSGQVITPEARTLFGTVSGISYVTQIEPDAGTSRLFFLRSDIVNFAPWQLCAVTIPALALLGSEDIPLFSGEPRNLLRWGRNGLALGTTGDQVILFTTNLIP